MARAGQVIHNPITGERITFLQTSADTGGESLSVEVESPPRAKGVPLHYHLVQTESFEALEGTLDLHAHGRDLRLQPGESAAVPPSIVHRFWNGSDRPARFRVDIQHPGRIETSLEAGHGLARDGKATKNGVPKNLFQLALLFELSESYLAGPPVPVQRAIFGTLARLARLLGYSDEFPQYAGISVDTPSTVYPLIPGEGASTLGPPESGPAESGSAEAAAPTSAPGAGKLPWVSLVYLVTAATGAAVAIREDLPGEFAGKRSGRSASADFFKGTGTALSPGLAMLAAQMVFTALSTRGGKAGTAGAAGLTVLGAGATVGMMGEPITYKILSPNAFDPAKAPLVSALIALPALMTVLGVKQTLAMRSGR